MEEPGTVELLKQFGKKEAKSVFENIEEVSEENDPGSPHESVHTPNHIFFETANLKNKFQVSAKNKTRIKTQIINDNEVGLNESVTFRNETNSTKLNSGKKRNKKIKRTKQFDALNFDKNSSDSKKQNLKSNKLLRRFTDSSISRPTVFTNEIEAFRKTSLNFPATDDLFQIIRKRKPLEIEIPDNEIKGFGVSDKRTSKTEHFWKNTSSFEKSKMEIVNSRENTIFYSQLKNQKKKAKKNACDLSKFVPSNFQRIGFKSFVYSTKSAKANISIDLASKKNKINRVLNSKEALANEQVEIRDLRDYQLVK